MHWSWGQKVKGQAHRVMNEVYCRVGEHFDTTAQVSRFSFAVTNFAFVCRCIDDDVFVILNVFYVMRTCMLTQYSFSVLFPGRRGWPRSRQNANFSFPLVRYASVVKPAVAWPTSIRSFSSVFILVRFSTGDEKSRETVLVPRRLSRQYFHCLCLVLDSRVVLVWVSIL